MRTKNVIMLAKDARLMTLRTITQLDWSPEHWMRDVPKIYDTWMVSLVQFKIVSQDALPSRMSKWVSV